MIFEQAWFQDNIPKNMFNHKESREIGIGCSKSIFRDAITSSVVCVFVSAQKVVSKKVVENIPSYTMFFGDPDPESECYYDDDFGYLEMF